MGVKVQIINKSQFDLPQYATIGSAGMDVRGDFSLFGQVMMGDPIGVGCAVATVDEEGYPLGIYIPPHARILIPTGIYIALPNGYEMQVRPRSGLALKYGLTVLNSPGTIDADYRGECKTILINTSDEPVTIAHGERICQWVLKEVPQVEWVPTDSLDETVRGEGGFGHTGKK